MGSYFPHQRSNQCPMCWKHWVLTTGPPEKSQGDISLWFWFAVLWWLVMLGIFSYIYCTFICLLSIQKFLFSSLSIFKSDFLLFSCKNFLYILNISLLSDIQFLNIFFYSVGHLFVFCFFFAVQKIFFLFDIIPFVYICFCSLSFWCHIQEIIAKTNVIKLSSSVFFKLNFMVSQLKFKYLIYCEVIFVHVVR